MSARVFVATLALVITLPASDLAALATPVSAGRTTETVTTVATVPDGTINEFLPEERGLGECISAVPKPGCGSSARGGWRQGVVLLAILAGLGVIAWRVVVSSRRARREFSSSRTPGATTARVEPDGDPAP